MPLNHNLSDDYVAELLAKDAKSNTARYSSYGLNALLPKRPTTNAPKPNTRFLKNIIKETDNHNAALRAKERDEARARLRRLRGDREEDRFDEDYGRLKRRRISPDDEEDREVWRRDKNSESWNKSKDDRRKRYRSSHNSRIDMSSGGEEDAGRSRWRKERDYNSRRRSHKYDDNECNSSEEEDDNSSHWHHHRHHHRSHRHHRSEDRESRSKNRTRRSQSPSRRNHHHHRSRRRRNSSSPNPPTTNPSTNHNPPTTKNLPSPSPSSTSSDPLLTLLPPPPPPSLPRPRGRGTTSLTPHTLTSTIDTHFSPNYNPALDTSHLHSHLSSDPETDWDQALEALRDRQRWKETGAERLRAAGFGEEVVGAWERGRVGGRGGGDGEDGDVASVRWRGRGHGREWDRGKVVLEGGEVETGAEWGRLRGT